MNKKQKEVAMEEIERITSALQTRKVILAVFILFFLSNLIMSSEITGFFLVFWAIALIIAFRWYSRSQNGLRERLVEIKLLLFKKEKNGTKK